jgi:hypothetical protein
MTTRQKGSDSGNGRHLYLVPMQKGKITWLVILVAVLLVNANMFTVQVQAQEQQVTEQDAQQVARVFATDMNNAEIEMPLKAIFNTDTNTVANVVGFEIRGEDVDVLDGDEFVLRTDPTQEVISVTFFNLETE